MNKIESKYSRGENVLIASNAEMIGLLEELLREGKSVRMRIKGRSMQPLLRDGLEEVELTQPEEWEIKRNEVVLFRYGEDFLLHRIITRKGDKLILRGDNVFQSKEVISIEKVSGIVRKVIYPGGNEASTSSPGWRLKSFFWLTIKPAVRISLYIPGAWRRFVAIFRR